MFVSTGIRLLGLESQLCLPVLLSDLNHQGKALTQSGEKLGTFPRGRRLLGTIQWKRGEESPQRAGLGCREVSCSFVLLEQG